MDRRTCLTSLLGVAGGLSLLPARAAAARSSAWFSQASGGGAPLPTILGPDPNTHAPRFKVPAGTVDTHTHIFGPNSKYPYAASRTYTPPDAPLEMFRALHAKIGVERAVIVNATVHGTDNRVVTDAIAVSGGKYKGIAVIDETFTDRQLQDLNAAGIKGFRQTFIGYLGAKADLGAVERLAKRVAPLGWHVDLYIEAEHLDDYLPMLGRLPMPYVLDHMGVVKAAKGIDQPGFQSLLTLMRQDKRCHVKVTGPERASQCGAPFYDAVPYAQKIIEAAPDRVLWGSDWPHPNLKSMPNDGDLVDLIPLYAPDPVHRRKLLVDNPVRLFGFNR